MKCTQLIVFIILVGGVLACGSSRNLPTGDDFPLINFEPNNTLGTVLDKADAEGKIVFIDLYADWCLPCKIMDADVYGDKATAEFMNDNFINYKVNGEKGEGPDLMVLYRVEGFPTQLFLDSRGNILEKNLGSLGIVGFNVLAERALSKANDSN